MNTEKIKQLLDKYFEGESSLEEEQLLRNYFQNREVPDHLKSYRDQFGYTSEFSKTEPGKELNLLGKINFEEEATGSPLKPAFAEGELRRSSYGYVGCTAPRRQEGLRETAEKDTEPETFDSRGMYGLGNQLNNMVTWTLRIAAGLILLLVGFSAGLLINQQNSASTRQVAELQQEIQQMKAALVYGTGRELTASERISAVKLSEKVPDNTTKLDTEITDILIYTMNNDQNINVREAAAEALFRFRNEPRIRKALVNSLSRQNDPLMQMALINMLVELKEKSAINEMQKLLMDSDTRDVVKSRLEVGIAELKT